MKTITIITVSFFSLVAYVLWPLRAQQVTATYAVYTNTIFTPTSLTGANAANWGAQFAAITNLSGTPVYTVNALTNAFGLPGVTRSILITVANNPQGGSNYYTVNIASQ